MGSMPPPTIARNLRISAKSMFGFSTLGVAMSLFYTGKGDKGSSVVGKKKIKKTNPFVEALGELDELNSMTGILKADNIRPELRKVLHQIQENLFIIQANLAYAMLREKRRPPTFSAHKTSEAEKIIDAIEKKLRPAKGFVISGSTRVSAWLDMLRARSRRVERSVLKINNSKLKIQGSILPYLNRLSSLFFALARDEAFRAGKKEQHPNYR